MIPPDPSDELPAGRGGGGRGRRFHGVAVGVVIDNQDPEALGRVKVRFPELAELGESAWARVATPMAGAGRGLYLLPEVGDEVLVAFEHGDARFPYVLGALWNDADRPPENNSDGRNNFRTLRTRSGHRIRFDDSEGAERIEIVDKGGSNSIVIDSAANSITISADADLVIRSHSGTLVLEGNGIEITSRAGVRIRGSRDLEIMSADLEGAR